MLEYFDAFLIGLTATPTTQTIGFFNRNLVQEDTFEKAVADGVSAGYDVYRIEAWLADSTQLNSTHWQRFVQFRLANL